jgi:hypothetical protein
MIIIRRNPKYKTGWEVQASGAPEGAKPPPFGASAFSPPVGGEEYFQISLHKKDLSLLKLIQNYFNGVGIIYIDGKDTIQFHVTSLVYLQNVIIPHFDKFPLITQKKADFELFKLAVDLMSRKEHLTVVGLQEIVSIKASMNLGLSGVLKEAFTNTI